MQTENQKNLLEQHNLVVFTVYAVELHLSGLIGTASH